jgi:hypothetical protein
LFTISPLLPKSRDFIKRGMGTTENYLLEIINDIEKKENKLIIGVKYVLHIILSVIMSVFIALFWPIIFLGFAGSVISYLVKKS